MINIVLFEPDIAQNTGNIARTCAATGIDLHLIEPLGFNLNDKKYKRAGMDYLNKVNIRTHLCLEDYFREYPFKAYFVTKFGDTCYSKVTYKEDLSIVFGSETRGLSEEIHLKYSSNRVYIPMKKEENIRSLNLSNSVAIIIYEIIRQLKIQL